ncbi:hypothetical protein EDB89DRAFT_1957069 [Lactarius sanguifluus]|nr:hypothetical protein EDB89DRAFT_1957069 [Lactarius sanguifluus]
MVTVGTQIEGAFILSAPPAQCERPFLAVLCLCANLGECAHQCVQRTPPSQAAPAHTMDRTSVMITIVAPPSLCRRDGKYGPFLVVIIFYIKSWDQRGKTTQYNKGMKVFVELEGQVDVQRVHVYHTSASAKFEWPNYPVAGASPARDGDTECCKGGLVSIGGGDLGGDEF